MASEYLSDAHFDRAHRYGFRYEPGRGEPAAGARARERSHDDGPDCGPFLGGLGGPNFARGLKGSFSRWQLEPGRHGHQDIDAAFFMLRWRTASGAGYRRLREGPGGFDALTRSVAVLYPLVVETYDDPALPFVLTLEYFSPLLPEDEASSALPVTLFSAHVAPRGTEESDVAIGLCWPNLLGWSLPPMTPARREGILWPNQSHAGQVHHDAKEGAGRLGIVQTRESLDIDTIPPGEVALMAEGTGWELSRALSFKADQNALGRPDAEQRYTIAHMEAAFAGGTGWAGYDKSWSAHWHEPLASAIAGRVTMKEKAPAPIHFAIAMDVPVVRFGMGRRWWRAYTETVGREGNNGSRLAARALDAREDWLERIGAWQDRMLERNTEIAPAAINQLAFLTGGGTAYLAEALDKPERKELRNPAHFGLLEGFDSGYYYYNTLDLWVYAAPALSLTYPRLAESVFQDFIDTIAMRDERQRIVYRTETMEPILVEGKLPHDLGAPPEDPFVRLNGYVMRDDPNLWKDHNPAFIVAFALHRQITGQSVTADDYAALTQAAAFTIAQDVHGEGVPRHSDFGDSTWDNLDMRGHSTYAAGLCLAAWAVMERLAAGQGDSEGARRYSDLRARAGETLQTLWTGSFYRTNSDGKYRDATQADALFGPWQALLMGIDDLIPPDTARAHLGRVYETNFLAFGEGRFGPLLVAEPGVTDYERDGGEELQVNEVLVGSGYVLAGCLRAWGLIEESRNVLSAMTRHHDETARLQFRTPAAWDGQGCFRAPLNMRPLALWAMMAGD
ncbi:GH116 family glycosyl hydrolase [Chelativorans sp. YIM 93263]|uniref:GH116 family glycosyl hydrolase n=1 Tax=Chelativorans sp. YIM 93263 TaxID=2906648 RepID=UPI002379439F|nr:GH116 family glycosyl hydrolase [Chelativorans sp. YIM 93263]